MRQPQFIEGLHPDLKWIDIRKYRDYLITQTDWTQMPDAQLSDEVKSKFIAYRQALRDIPQNVGDPDDVVWPTKPDLPTK